VRRRHIPTRWTRFGIALFIALALYRGANADDTRCAPPVLGGCNIGMALDAFVRRFPTATSEIRDGLRVLSTNIKDPLPGAVLGEGKLEVTFDKSSSASAIWFVTKADPPEHEIVSSVKKIWGEPADQAHYDFANKGITNMSWASCSQVSRMLNVVYKGTPQVTTIHIGLERESQ
jgi:hypothetical protein